MADHDFTVTMEQLQDYEFKVSFDMARADDIVMDEPEPLGAGNGPNATRLIAAAVGNCLTASLLFCLQKSRVEADGFHTTVTGTLERNDKGRFRIGGLEVRLQLPEGLDGSRLQRCLGLYEDFCVVTASIRNGIPVTVEVVDAEGNAVA